MTGRPGHANEKPWAAAARDSLPRGSIGAQSIQRAFSILRILATGGGRGLRLKDVTDESGLSNPTVHRILKSLVDEGAAEQDPETRRYRVGEEIAVLAMANAARFPIRPLAEEHLYRLAAETGDAVALTVRRDLDALCIDRKMGTSPIQVLTVRVGDRRPLGVTVASQVILADLDDQEIERILEANANRLRRFSLDLPQIRERVQLARKRGYVYARHGVLPHTSGIAVPVRNIEGKVIAALSIITISERLPAERIPELHMAMEREGVLLSRRLGSRARL